MRRNLRNVNPEDLPPQLRLQLLVENRGAWAAPEEIEQIMNQMPARRTPPMQHARPIRMESTSIIAPIAFDDEERYPFNQSCDFIEGRYLFAGFANNSNMMVIDVWHRAHKILRPIEGPSKSNKLPKNFCIRMITNRTGLLILSMRIAFREFDNPRIATYAKLIDFDVGSGTYTFRKNPCRFVTMSVNQTFTVQGNKLVVIHRSNANSYGRIYRIDLDSKDDDNWLNLIDTFNEEREAAIWNLKILNNRLFYWDGSRANATLCSIRMSNPDDMEEHLMDISSRRRIMLHEMPKHYFLRSQNPQVNAFPYVVHGCWDNDLFYQITCVAIPELQYVGVLHQPTTKRTDYTTPLLLRSLEGNIIKMGIDFRSNHLVIVSRPTLDQPYIRTAIPRMMRVLKIYRFPLNQLGTEPSSERHPKSLFERAFWVASENQVLFQQNVPKPLRPFTGLLS
ncbi:hypothetical protein M3Y94_00898200 [Aphelenchoides besseyi]|nr:hypothetical protein M3Y94_00898200 [Aphelenchoides besseyi]